jgi:hypothetical protein
MIVDLRSPNTGVKQHSISAWHIYVSMAQKNQSAAILRQAVPTALVYKRAALARGLADYDLVLVTFFCKIRRDIVAGAGREEQIVG